MKKNRLIKVLVLATILLTLVSCSGNNQNNTAILGAGSSFGYPIYNKIFSMYHQESNKQVNYQSIGSSGGIQQLMAKKIDFGGTDKFISNEEISKLKSPIIHIPTTIGAIVLAYNLPGNPKIKLSREVLSEIYLGKIKKWNDPKIIDINQGIALPNRNITVVHRSDGSGTTYNFTLYLSRINKDWESKVGVNASISWPTGIGGKGNEGVAGIVRQTPGSIGYVELAYALQTGLKYASIENNSGNYVEATHDATSSSANVNLPEDSRIYILNSSTPDAYPISSFTWIILYKEQNYDNRTKQQATELVKSLWWLIHEGQQYCKPLHYVSLPENAVKIAEDLLKSVTYNGLPILSTEQNK